MKHCALGKILKSEEMKKCWLVVLLKNHLSLIRELQSVQCFKSPEEYGFTLLFIFGKQPECQTNNQIDCHMKLLTAILSVIEQLLPSFSTCLLATTMPLPSDISAMLFNYT